MMFSVTNDVSRLLLQCPDSDAGVGAGPRSPANEQAVSPFGLPTTRTFTEDDLVALLTREEPRLRAMLGLEMPNRHAAVLSVDDVLQETWIDAWLEYASLVSHSKRSVQAWLNSIAQRNLIDACRMLDAQRRGGRGRRWPSPQQQGQTQPARSSTRFGGLVQRLMPGRLSAAGSSAERPSSGAAVAGPAGSASLKRVEKVVQRPRISGAARHRERVETLRSVLADLPPEARRLIEAFDLRGQPMAEVARELGCSVGAAYMKRARALRRLRSHLGQTSIFFSTRA
ncbi:MAG: RNA polymerase sigma factor [Planctomycetota bacterium]